MVVDGRTGNPRYIAFKLKALLGGVEVCWKMQREQKDEECEDEAEGRDDASTSGQHRDDPRARNGQEGDESENACVQHEILPLNPVSQVCNQNQHQRGSHCQPAGVRSDISRLHPAHNIADAGRAVGDDCSRSIHNSAIEALP